MEKDIQNLRHNQESMAEKIDKLVSSVNDIKVSIARIPQEILDLGDDRYASKASEVRLNNLEARIESRSYDWLRQSVITIVSIILAAVVYSRIQ